MRSLDAIFADAKGITYEEQVRRKKPDSAATQKLKPLAEIFAEARQDKGTVARSPSAVPSIPAAPKTPVAKPTLPVSQAEKEILDAAMKRYFPGVASTTTPTPAPRPLPVQPETATQQIFGSLGKSIAEAPQNMEKKRVESEVWKNNPESDPAYRFINAEYLDTPKEYTSINTSILPYDAYMKINEQERAEYNRVFATAGREAANKYLDDLMPTLNQRVAEETTKQVETLAEDYPVVSSVLSVPANLGGGLAGGVDLVAQNANRALTGKPVDYFTPAQQVTRAAGTVRQTVGENIAEATPNAQLFGMNIPSWLYSTGMSAADSLAAGLTMGGVGAFATLGASAGVSEAQEIAARGGTDGQAYAGAWGAALLEAAFEKLSLGNLKAMQAVSAKGWRNILKNIAKAMGVNASEELFTEAANAAFDAVVLGDASEWMHSIDGYMAQGMTEEDAIKRTMLDIGGRSLQAAASGALMGGGFGVLGTVQGKVMNRGADAAQTEDAETAEEPDVESADAVTREYEQAVDGRVLAMAESVARAGAKSVAPLNLGAINNAHADILRELTGVDYSGYTIQLTGDALQHIANRHGENGAADSSMADMRDVARIGWVVENFDNAALIGDTRAYLNSDSSRADVVLLQKRINGNYYVAEAVPDAKAKTLYIQSAYKNRTLEDARWSQRPPLRNAQDLSSSGSDNGAPGGARWNQRLPLRNVQDLPPGNSAVDTNISQPTGGVNGEVDNIPQEPYTQNVGGVQRGEREALSDDGGQWDGRQRAGEQTGRLVEGAERTGRRAADRSREAIRRKNRAADLRGPLVSSREIGIEQGVERKTVRVMPEEIWDDGMRAIAEKARREARVEVTFVSGSLSVRGGDGAEVAVNGVFEPGRIIVQADNMKYSAEQIADHELYHDWVFRTPGVQMNVKRKVVSQYGEDEFNAIVAKYAQAMRGIVGITDDMSEDDYNKAMRVVEEEVFADAYAGIDRRGDGATQFTEAVRETVRDTREANGERETRGPPGARFSMEERQPKTRFSLDGPVEETRDLIALHNISEAKLRQAIELGGFPMPSIAVTKAEIGHTNFGDISLVFGKDTINPTDRRNEIYGADAWTPTFPEVGYKIDDKKQRALMQWADTVARNHGLPRGATNFLVPDNIKDELRSANGDIVEAYANKNDMRLLYAADTIPGFEPVMAEKKTQFGYPALREVISALGEETVLDARGWDYDKVKALEPVIREAVNTAYEREYGREFRKGEPLGFSDIDNILRDAKNFIDNGGPEMGFDTYATRDAVNKIIDEGTYRAWLAERLDGIVARRGIRNQRDLFAPSGNRRSFEALYNEYTLDNIVAAMAKEVTKGKGALGGGVGPLSGAATKQYKTIEQARADKGRLQKLSDEELEARRDEHSERMRSIVSKMVDGRAAASSFSGTLDAGDVIVEAAQRARKATGLYSYMRQWGDTYNVTMEIAYDIEELIQEMSNMPVSYFEAKPRRAVPLREVAAAVVPDTSNAEVMTQLERAGVPVVSYEAGNEQSRIEAVNSVPNVRFSVEDTDDAVVINETATRAEANAALAALAGKTLVNDETGIEAQINSNQRTKIISNAAVTKSMDNGFTGNEHYAAAAHIAELWKRAHLAEERGDRNEAANMLSVKRFTSAMSVAGTPATAYITAKESVDAGHRIYSLELMEIEETPLPQGSTSSKDNDTTGKSASYKTSISDAVQNVNRRFLGGGLQVFYDDENRAEARSMQLGVQFPSGQPALGSAEEASRPHDGTSSKDNDTAGRNASYRNSISDAEPNVKRRFSTDDQEPRRAKPVAESRPIIAKRELKQTLLSLFSTPDGTRAELGATIDHYADRLLRDGALTEADRKAFFDRMYEMGVMEVPPDEYFAAGRGYIVGGRVYVNEQIRAEFGDDWNDFRKKAFGYGVYLTNSQSDTGVDVWGRDLSELVPGLFEEGETDGRTILERMVWVAQEGLSEKMSLANYALELAGREWINEDEYLDNMERQMDWALRTFAEKANLETRLRSRADSRISKDREREIASRARADERQKLAGQMERAAERESAAEKRYQDLQQKQRELIRRANTRADRKEMTQRQKEKRELRELQQKTLRQLQWLSKNRRKAPADLRKVWDETLGDIDIFAAGVVRETFRGEPLRAKWENMAQIYKQAQSSDKNFLPTPQLATIVKRLDNYKIENMDYAALKDLYDAAVGLHKEFSERNNVIDDEYNRLMSEVYEDSKKEIEGADNKFLGMTLLTPVNMLEGMAGWNPDSTFFSMAKQLEKGERDMHTHEAQANKLLEKFLRENEKWARRAGGQGKDGIWYEEEVPELIDLKYGDDPVFGKKVKVHFTAAQKVHMYLEIQNEDNLRHMVGGRTFADKELYKKGKREEAFYKGTTVALAPETARWLVRDMTPQELGLARALDSYYNGYSKAKINEVSNKLYGYDKAIGTSYAPIYTNQNYTQNEIGVFDITAEGVGNLKERLLSKVPTLNIGAFDAFERSVGKTARFVGMAIPARNWNTLLNRKDKGYDNSMMDVITHKWGKAGKEKIKNVLEELQGGGEQKLNIVDSAVQKYVWGKYISSTFAANPSIVLKQLGSIPMAGAYLGGKNKPSLAKVFKVNRDLIGKYTSELDYRLMGYATPETRQIKENPSLLDRNRVSRFFLRGGAITAMDGWAAGTLWPWAENKVRREHPELETGTQEEIDAGQSPFYRAVAEEFNNALNRSQSVSDIMHQSELRRDKGTIARMLTQFKSDTAQAYNALWQSLGEARHYARRGEKTEAGKAASRAALVAAKKVVGGVLWGIALNQIWGAAIDFLMNLWKKEGDRYTDENGELTLESVVGEAGYSIATSIFGLVPGGEELAEVLGSWVLGRDWWGIEAPGIEQINDLIEGLGKAGKKIGDIVGGGIDIANNGGDAWEHLDRNKAELLGGVKDIAKTVTRYVPGLPLDNIEAYLLGTVRKVFPGAATAYEDAFAEADKAGLAGLEGDALEARVAGILDNRLNGAKGETAAALAGLYAEGFKKAIPSDTPSSISVDGESVKLTAYQKQTYDLVWRSAVGASLDDLTASREFGSASDEDKEKMLDRLYRYAGEKAKQELFDGYEPDDWVSKADEAVKSGMSAGEWATLYTEISLIDGDTTLKGAQKSNKKREVISHSGLSDAQKIMLYSHTISEERIDDIKAFQTAKLPFDVFLAAQNEYATLNERKDLTATQKATELSRWANQRGYKGEQAAAIRDTFTFFSMAPAEARRYNELTDSGVNDEDAYELTNALNELEPLEGNKSVTNLQRYRETVDISTNPDIQLSLLMSVMGETEIQKVKLAYDYGVTPRDYVRAKELIAEDNKQKKAEDEDYGGVKNKDVEDVLESMDDLTRNQQAALYQVITRAKRNPFGSRIRREIEKALEGDGE